MNKIRIAIILIAALIGFTLNSFAQEDNHPTITTDTVDKFHELYVLGETEPLAVSWSYDGTLIAISTQLTVNIYDAETYTLQQRIPKKSIDSIFWSFDGSYIALGDAPTHLWSTVEERFILTIWHRKFIGWDSETNRFLVDRIQDAHFQQEADAFEIPLITQAPYRLASITSINLDDKNADTIIESFQEDQEPRFYTQAAALQIPEGLLFLDNTATLSFWDENLNVMYPLREGSNLTTSSYLSASGEVLIGSDSGELLLFNPLDNSLSDSSLSWTSAIRNVDASPSGTAAIVVTDDDTLRLIDTSSMLVQFAIPVTSLSEGAWSANGQQFAYIRDNTVNIIDYGTLESVQVFQFDAPLAPISDIMFRGHTDEFYSVETIPYSAEGVIRSWDISTQQSSVLIDIENPRRFDIRSDGEEFVIATNNNYQFWNVDPLTMMQRETWNATFIQYHPHQSIIAYIVPNDQPQAATSHVIRFYDIDLQQTIAQIDVESESANPRGIFSSSGEIFLMELQEHIQAWDWASEQLLWEQASITGISATIDGVDYYVSTIPEPRTITLQDSVPVNDTITIYDGLTGNEFGAFDVLLPNYPLQMSSHPFEPLVMIGTPRGLYLVDISTGEVIWEIVYDDLYIGAFTWSPNGYYFAYALLTIPSADYETRSAINIWGID